MRTVVVWAFEIVGVTLVVASLRGLWRATAVIWTALIALQAGRFTVGPLMPHPEAPPQMERMVHLVAHCLNRAVGCWLAVGMVALFVWRPTFIAIRPGWDIGFAALGIALPGYAAFLCARQVERWSPHALRLLRLPPPSEPS